MTEASEQRGEIRSEPQLTPEQRGFRERIKPVEGPVLRDYIMASAEKYAADLTEAYRMGQQSNFDDWMSVPENRERYNVINARLVPREEMLMALGQNDLLNHAHNVASRAIGSRSRVKSRT